MNGAWCDTRPTAVCLEISGINFPRYARYADTVLLNADLKVSLSGSL